MAMTRDPKGFMTADVASRSPRVHKGMKIASVIGIAGGVPMDKKKRDEQLDDTEIRRDTQVRGSLGQPASGLNGDEWCEEVIDCDDNTQRDQVRNRTEESGQPSSEREDDDRQSER